MKVLILLGLVAATCANLAPEPILDPLHSIIADQLIPLGDKIRKAEERMNSQRIVGGQPAVFGQFPYQAGLLARYENINGTGVCGGVLISADRVATAAHCWFDGINTAASLTVVLGSLLLFTGGQRFDTSSVVMHPDWNPARIRNDVAVIYLPTRAIMTGHVSPIDLPSSSKLNDTFAGFSATASGFGLTSDGGSFTTGQFLFHVSLNIITNLACSMNFPILVQSSNICTSGNNGASTCRGDSGGPLVVTSNARRILVGITSFGSPRGCQAGAPTAYARVTSFMDFFQQHIN